MAEITLAEKVKEDFLKIKLRKLTVKVPKLRTRKIKQARLHKKIAKDGKMPTSLLVRILIKNALEDTKKERKESKKTDKKYTQINEEKDTSASGYGAASAFYSAKSKSPYVDYEKLFSYLGKFKAKGSFYSDAPTESLNINIESKSFELVSREAMDKGARYAKYFFPKVADFHSNLTSLVPVAGMSSAEWEQFKLMMLLDPVMYSLKSKVA